MPQYPLDTPGLIQWVAPTEEEVARRNVASDVPTTQTSAPPAARVAADDSSNAEAKALFTLNINVTGAEGGASSGVVPLEFVEGQKPAEAAAAFAKAHGLPEVSAQELTVAIVQYAKQNGFGE